MLNDFDIEKKKTELDFMYYYFGQQHTNFRCFSKNGDIVSKWRYYWDFGFNIDKEFISEINNRTILDNEIVLDIDEELFQNLPLSQLHLKLDELFNFAIELLEKFGINYYAYRSGSRGYHIHIFCKGLQTLKKYERENIRETIIKFFGADISKKNDGAPITMENCNNSKTGKKKELLRSRAGLNFMFSIAELINNTEAKQAISRRVEWEKMRVA